MVGGATGLIPSQFLEEKRKAFVPRELDGSGTSQHTHADDVLYKLCEWFFCYAVIQFLSDEDEDEVVKRLSAGFLPHLCHSSVGFNIDLWQRRR